MMYTRTNRVFPTLQGNLFQDISKEMVDEVEASLLKVEGEDGGYLYVTPEELQM